VNVATGKDSIIIIACTGLRLVLLLSLSDVIVNMICCIIWVKGEVIGLENM
jgi:hypothetical protein